MFEVNTNRLDQAFARIQAYPSRDASLDQRFRELILSAEDERLNRLNAYTLAAAWGVSEPPILLWLIYASRVGLFDLHWVTHCGHCNGTTGMAARMGEVGHETYCKMCESGTPIHSDENIEVAFTVNPAIRPTQESLKANMAPGAVPIGQWDGKQPITLNLDRPGKYYLLNLQDGHPSAASRFDVEKDSAPRSEITIVYSPEIASPSELKVGLGSMTVTTEGATHIVGIFRDFVAPLPPRRVTGLDVMLLPEFKEIFAHDTLSQRESLSVKSLTILFTDITGSTTLYRHLGDVRAYNLVRDHFDVLFREIERFDGLVIKTIGDSVMAAFASPDHALSAALAVQHSIKQFNQNRKVEDGNILVKIGLHEGSAIAVNLNNTLDYFGNMVNLAARIQSKSRSNEVLLSEQVRRDTEVQRILDADPSLIVTDSLFELQGIGEERLFSIMTQ